MKQMKNTDYIVSNTDITISRKDQHDAQTKYGYFETPDQAAYRLYEIVAKYFKDSKHSKHSKYSKYSKQEKINIIDPTSGLGSMAKYFIIDKHDIVNKIILNDINTTMCREVEQRFVVNFPNVQVANEDFLYVKTKTFSENPFNVIICNPPFSYSYITGPDANATSDSVFYLFFIIRALDVLKMSSHPGEKHLYMTCPRKLFNRHHNDIYKHLFKHGDKLFLTIPDQYITILENHFGYDLLSKFIKQIENDSYILIGAQISFIERVSGFAKLTNQYHKTKIFNEGYALFRFILNS